MPVAAILGLGSAVIGASAANRAASAQSAAARNDLALKERIYNEQSKKFSPFLETGQNALAAYNSELGLGPRPDGYEGFQKTPGYQFALDQGRDTVDASAASRGNLYSGATLTALNKFGQGFADQNYERYTNKLRDLAGMGQSAAGQQGAAAQNYSQGAGNAFASIGNAQSAGAIGVANALNGGIQNGIGLYQYNQLAGNNKLFGGNSWG